MEFFHAVAGEGGTQRLLHRCVQFTLWSEHWDDQVTARMRRLRTSRSHDGKGFFASCEARPKSSWLRRYAM